VSFPVVGIGASAGGLEAFSELLGRDIHVTHHGVAKDGGKRSVCSITPMADTNETRLG
jgi:hypothetical protein